MLKYKILIVDDEDNVREGVVSRVDWDELGFEIIAEAENGQDALEKAESKEIDVVLTDIKMPFMDGLAMCEKLSQMYPGIKIIVLSGFDEFEYAKAAIRLNVVEYVLKPVNVAELTEILRRVKRLLDEGIEQKRNIEALRESYIKALPLMRELFLDELLRGIVAEKDIDAHLNRYELPVNQAPYKVAAVFEVDVKDKHSPLVGEELVPVSVKQLVEEHLRGHCRSAVFIRSSLVVAITAWDDPNPIGMFMNIVREICSHCARVLELSVTAGIGGCYERVADIHNSFSEAKSALEYKVIAGVGRAIYIHDMENAKSEIAISGIQEYEQLLSTIKFGSSDQMRALIEAFSDSARTLGEWERQMYFFSLFSAVCQIVRRYDLLAEDAVVKRLDHFLKARREWTDEALMSEWFIDICNCISEYISAKRKTAPQNLIGEARRFIDNNYQDSSLSVERLCEHLHVSPSYFSTVFKQETGKSYVQYLTELRLTKAAELLQQTDGKAYEIAGKVGYDEPNYFSYVFKKHFGVSPTKYRR